MPKMNGMDFLRSMPKLPMIILTTAYGQYALEGYELAVIDYLVKPFSLERFLKAVQKALEFKTLREKKPTDIREDAGHFFVKCDGRIEKVICDELIYVEAMSNYIILHTRNGQLITYLTIKKILESLPAENFIQVHKSFVVNTDHINSIEGNTLHMGTNRITMGSNFSQDVLTRVLKNRYFKR